MHHIDLFLDKYVRLDEGTAVVLCIQRSSVQTGAWLYTAVVVRGADPQMVCFDHEEELFIQELGDTLALLRAKPTTRRVVVIVCESTGPSFVDVLENAPTTTSQTVQIFRITGAEAVVDGDGLSNGVGVG